MRSTALAQASMANGLHPAEAGSFAADVVAGLTASPKRLPPKYFYDSIGSHLFERITALPEYYLTRCELAILRERAAEIAEIIPSGAALIEFGSGSSRKTRTLLEAACKLAAYVPVDISREFLDQQVDQLRREYPAIAMLPVASDFSRLFDLPIAVGKLPRAGFFPGSTIGNFDPRQAATFLRQAGHILGAGAVFVIGVDLIKNGQLLHDAYNDSAGVTAEFNRNLLMRINRELGADFDPTGFKHKAFFNRRQHRIEMHLESLKHQRAKVCGVNIEFRPGETIHTENSYKYTVDSFQRLAYDAGWLPLRAWTDSGSYFSVHILRLMGEAVRRPPH